MIEQRTFTVEFVWFPSLLVDNRVLSESNVSYSDAYRTAYRFALVELGYRPPKWWEFWRWFGESKPPQGV